MSHPFIIWTLRRTGGTSLASLVMELSDHPGTQHEPFNVDRAFGEVTRNWYKTRDVPAMRGQIRQRLAGGRVLKHCYELMPHKLNRALLQVSTNLGFRHVVLDRRDEVARILSLELAKITGAWGKEAAGDIYEKIESGEQALPPIDLPSALGHMQKCQETRLGMADLFKEYDQEPFVVHFEDMYTDFDQGHAKLQDLFAFLDIDSSQTPDVEDKIRKALISGGQNSSRIQRHVPNLNKATRQLTRAYKRIVSPF